MFVLGFLVGASLMVAVSNVADRFDEIKKWNDNEE